MKKTILFYALSLISIVSYAEESATPKQDITQISQSLAQESKTTSIDDLIKKSTDIYLMYKDATTSEDINITAPTRAESGAQVPINLSIPKNTEQLTMLVRDNPIPIVAIYDFPTANTINIIDTRVRMEKDSFIDIFIKTTSNQKIKKSIYVKAAGGCGGGVLDDEKIARQNAWATKKKIKNGVAVIMIKHPMYTGLQKDISSGGTRNAWWVRNSNITLDKNSFLNVFYGVGMSEDPYMRIESPSIKENSEVSLELVDNENNKISK